MLYKDKNGSYTSDYLLDGEFTREMENNSNRVKNMNEVFDNYNLDNEDRDFWGDNCQNKDIDNFVDKLFSNDPFEESSLDLENEEYEGFDPEKLDKDNPFIQYEMEDNKVIADLNELREITKNTFEKFKNKIIKEL
ncbi:hypothetical protein A9X81_04910 [Brachyspira hyodysenteriae]|uniref:hypothetical protein n=1 Tax=Brachyspira hyodysenteriae TaxID=159 RepID=UPI001182E66E|nr:hypothetical protein [Brachyspira hyodysenteriae]TVL67064.1 hypothetical protein A9X74_01025 [Brachyspira hyodysenteriae]TVL77098.1 hypothetical protein A9X81_04910 [Brachyspira hyodysenteriae]TVL86598.1 hypothetical protein A9X80_03930 [Brachyspira hyodysenteriae]